jgi:hypothetical protein
MFHLNPQPTNQSTTQSIKLGRFEIEGGEKFFTLKKIIKFPWLIAKSYYSKAYKSKSVGRIFLEQ